MFWLSDVLTDTDTAQHMRHYEARARAARADAFRRTFFAAGRALAHVGAAATRGLLSPLRARHNRRNAVRDLHYLDDRLLADIGVTRGDVDLLYRGKWPTRDADDTQKQATITIVAGTEDKTGKGYDDQRHIERQRAA